MDNQKIDFWYQVGLDDAENARMTHKQQQQFLKEQRYNTKIIRFDENLRKYRYDENRNKIYL